MPTLYVDGTAHEIEPGDNVLEACLKLGYDLPYFCWHEAMGSVGACRQCAVKQFDGDGDDQGKVVLGCMTPAKDGTRVSIEDAQARQMRENVIEWLMVNHPHDCPVCDEGGECQLQDMTVLTGHNDREFRFRKRTFRNQYLGPFVRHEMNRCIQCYRCVRFYNDLAGGKDLAALGCHDHVYFGRHEDGPLQSVFSGNLVEVCPTGVFTDNTYARHYTRKWDLTTAPSVCTHCAVGCNTTPGERYGTLRRVRNRYHPEVNGWFLCDRGRFGYEHVDHESRIREPVVPGEAALADWARELAPERILAIGSPRASLESNFALRHLAGAENFVLGLSDVEHDLVHTTLRVLREGPARTPTPGQIERDVDAVLVLGEDVLHTAPRLALALRSAARNEPVREACARLGVPRWNDQPQRIAVQDATGPFFVATPDRTGLDDLATATVRAAPSDLARLGLAVARALDPEAPAVDLPAEQAGLAQQIATALRGARRPVVVTGTGCGSRAVIEAAAAVAWALCRAERPAWLSIVVPEVNTLGHAMLGGRRLSEVLADGTRLDAVIVLENDLCRRIPRAAVEGLFERARGVVALDALANPTVEMADVVLPTATFAEAAGTVVSLEGRAQRFFQVIPPDHAAPAGWRQVRDLFAHWGREVGWERLDDVLDALAEAHPDLAGAARAADRADWREAGERVPRQPHRYSGRTAMCADRRLSEPKPPSDPDSPLSFTMEGTSRPISASVRSFEWAAGWNSEQAVNRLLTEAREIGRVQDSGVRLIEPSEGAQVIWPDTPEAFAVRPDRVLLLDLHLALGTEERSAKARGVAERIPEPWVEIASADAERLGLVPGDEAWLRVGETLLAVPVRTSPYLPAGVARLPKGLPGLPGAWGLPLPAWATLQAEAAR